jgi:hypothetical protein
MRKSPNFYFVMSWCLKLSAPLFNKIKERNFVVLEINSNWLIATLYLKSSTLVQEHSLLLSSDILVSR